MADKTKAKKFWSIDEYTDWLERKGEDVRIVSILDTTDEYVRKVILVTYVEIDHWYPVPDIM